MTADEFVSKKLKGIRDAKKDQILASCQEVTEQQLAFVKALHECYGKDRKALLAETGITLVVEKAKKTKYYWSINMNTAPEPIKAIINDLNYVQTK